MFRTLQIEFSGITILPRYLDIFFSSPDNAIFLSLVELFNEPILVLDLTIWLYGIISARLFKKTIKALIKSDQFE